MVRQGIVGRFTLRSLSMFVRHKPTTVPFLAFKNDEFPADDVWGQEKAEYIRRGEFGWKDGISPVMLLLPPVVLIC